MTRRGAGDAPFVGLAIRTVPFVSGSPRPPEPGAVRWGLRLVVGAVARSGHSSLPLPRPRWVRRLLLAPAFLSPRKSGEAGGGRLPLPQGHRCRLRVPGAAGSHCLCLPIPFPMGVRRRPPPAHPPGLPHRGHWGFAACLPLLQADFRDWSGRFQTFNFFFFSVATISQTAAELDVACSSRLKNQ